MELLFIEDEISKERQITEYINSIFDEFKITNAKSLMSAIKLLQDDRYNIVLLDMSLPLYDFNSEIDEINEFVSFAGLDVLDELVRINATVKVIVITAFDIIEDSEKKLSLEQLDEQMRKEYSHIYIGSIFYNFLSLEWKKTLEKNLREAIKK